MVEKEKTGLRHSSDTEIHHVHCSIDVGVQIWGKTHVPIFNVTSWPGTISRDEEAPVFTLLYLVRLRLDLLAQEIRETVNLCCITQGAHWTLSSMTSYLSSFGMRKVEGEIDFCLLL